MKEGFKLRQALIIKVLLVVMVFSLGVILGNSWKSDSDVDKLLRASELDAESFRVEQELFKNFELNCGFAKKRLGALSEDLGRLGKVLVADNAREFLGEEFDFHKKKFHLMQIRTFVLEKKLASDCEDSGNVVLYYYSKNDPSSQVQGQILDGLVSEFDLHVFAIEYNYSKELRFLEEYYQINQTPALVVNFKELLVGPVSRDNLIPLFQKE